MSFKDALKRSLGFEEQLEDKHTNDFAHELRPTYHDNVTISPEHYIEDYEIMLIRPRTIDDINYMVDQITEEHNPVILDLSFLEKESPANFKLAGEKIKYMRNNYGAEALLLANTQDKNLIIISPSNVSLIRK